MRLVSRGGDPSVAGGGAAAEFRHFVGWTWQLAVDPQNAGREQKWFEKNPAETKEARVPGIIQECYPCYHGVASCGQA